ncbi:MAG TPA: RDD family protein [Campylobacterales bacterium]|nr:RDD family protein [Campylobacterales bacterium]
MHEQEEDNYQIATTRKRLSAFFIDDIVVSVFLLVIFYNELSAFKDPTNLILFLESNFLTFVFLRVIYHTFFVWQNGMTIGKMMMKIRVIEMDTGYTPTFGVAFLRAGFRVVSESIFYLGYIMAYFNPMVQTLHDKLSKTVVVDV